MKKAIVFFALVGLGLGWFWIWSADNWRIGCLWAWLGLLAWGLGLACYFDKKEF